ncbi:MAG: MOSC domain-containing protein [Candidatus Binatia bacterium]
MIVGKIVGIWRYPVKSMAGAPLERAGVGALGIPGDRGWALRDESAGEIRGAKKLPLLMQCSARYLEEPTEARIPAAEVTLPDGAKVRTDAPEAAARLSDLLGRKVTLWARRPANDRDHYRRGRPDEPDMERELRQVFGREADEPLPDLSVFSPELFEYTSPLGTYFDAFPLLLLTTAWLDELSRRNPSARFDVRRFRPNFLIEPENGRRGFVELGWTGKRLRIGAAMVEATVACPRCVMTTLGQQDLPKDPSVLRTIVRDSDQNVGVYASVVEPGAVAVGDRVDLL